MNIPKDLNPSPPIPFEILKRLELPPQVVLQALSPLMTDDLLEQIAMADYGRGAEECMEYLKEIVHRQQTPQKVTFIFSECLELTRWLLPESRDEHLRRAFSCTLLLILQSTSNYDNITDENEVLAGLTDSIVALQIAPKAVQGLIAWRILTDYEEEKAVYLEDEDSKDYVDEIFINEFFIYALLLMMLFNQEAEKDVERVVTWLIDMEKDIQNITPYYNQQQAMHLSDKHLNTSFLLGRSGFNQRPDVWKKLSTQMLTWTAYISTPSIKTKLETMVDCIVNEKVMKF